MKNIKKTRILIYALPNFIMYCLYLLAFYPGFMSPDSFDQWEQIQTLKWNDWHPVIHTLFEYLLTRIWNNPAIISIANIFIISFVIGYIFYSLERIGANKVLLLICSILASIFPANGIMTVSIWKDTDYSIMLALFTIIMINIFFSKGSWLDEKKNIALLVLASIGVMFFRHNGILSFASTMFFLIIFYKKYRKKTLILTGVFLISFVLIKGPIYSAMGVIPALKTEAYGIPMQQIAAVIKYNGNITEDEKQFLNKILPYKKWGTEYNMYSSNPLKFDKEFNGNYLLAHKFEFIKDWIAICIKNPKLSSIAYTDQTSLVWRFTSRPVDYRFIVQMPMPDNKYGISLKQISYKVTTTVFKIYVTTLEPKVEWFFWKPAFQLYIVLILGVLCLKKLGGKFVLTLVPFFSNVASFLIAMPAQDYRYLYSAVLIATIMIPLSITLVTNKSFNINKEKVNTINTYSTNEIQV